MGKRKATPLRSDAMITSVLGVLVGFDLSLALVATVAPELWFATVHEGVHTDALHRAFLMRSAGHWLALALVQIATLFTWKRTPVWLLLTAGARLSDVLTDLLYLATAPARSPLAWVLLGSPIANLALAALFIEAYRSAARASRDVSRASRRSSRPHD